MDRRAFLSTVAGGLLAAPLAGEAQRAGKLPQLCFLTFDPGTSRSPATRFEDCEGGAVALASLQRAGILDEIFFTVTDVHIEPSEHEGVRRILPLEPGPARLIAEGRASDPGYLFQRWRLNDR